MNDSQSELSDSRIDLVRSPDSASGRLLTESSSLKSPSHSRISSPHRMSGDELREREQRIILETSSQGGTGSDRNGLNGSSNNSVPTISGSKATLNDIRYRGSGKGLEDSLSSRFLQLLNTCKLLVEGINALYEGYNSSYK